MKMLTAISAAGLLTACGAGDWVDAPAACRGGWGMIDMIEMDAVVKAAREGKAVERNPDLKAYLEEQFRKEKVANKEADEVRKGFDTAIAVGAREVCGNVGKSYTGTWECTAEQQRVKCK